MKQASGGLPQNAHGQNLMNTSQKSDPPRPTLYTDAAIVRLESEKRARLVAVPAKPETRRKLIEAARVVRHTSDGLPELPEAA
jgi:hypothetical protein